MVAELPFLTLAEAKARADAMRRGVPRREPVVITCLDAPGLFHGERCADLSYAITHEIDFSDDDLPAKRNKAKWDERREIKWLADAAGGDHVQLALARFKRAITRGAIKGPIERGVAEVIDG